MDTAFCVEALIVKSPAPLKNPLNPPSLVSMATFGVDAMNAPDCRK